MSPTHFSIRNPLVVSGIAGALCLFGAFAFSSLGVAVAPNVNIPQAVVTTTYPGADPATIEANVTRPIEDAIATLPNIDAYGLTSTSTSGVSIVSVQFTSAANADLVAVDVQRVVNGARANLPADAEMPTVTKVDLNAQGVATVVLSGSGSGLNLTRLEDLAENSLQQQLNAVPGVGATAIRSGIKHEIHVTVDQDALRARGLSINTVAGALQMQQVEVPAGTIAQGTTDLSVYFDSVAPRIDALNDLVIQQTQNGPIYLRDVATVRDTFKTRSSIVRVDGREGISLVSVKLADANNISVVSAVKLKIAELNKQLPPGTHLDLVVDASMYTARSFNTVRNALLEAIFATGLILLLFLHTWRSTLIVLVSIPVSLLSTLALMAVLHYNLNLLTMVALVVSVGILVDDSIVVLENISRHLRTGKLPLDATIDGRTEIGLAAITITLVDVVVYVPLAVMTTGVPAQFLQPFAVVITAATLSSLAVSFTLTPMLARFFLQRPDSSVGTSPLARSGRVWDAGFDQLERGYERLLGWTVPRRWRVIAGGLASFAAGIGLLVFGLVGLDFFPSGDQSELDITLTMPASTTLDATNSTAQKIEAELRTVPEVRSLYSVVGQSSMAGQPTQIGGANQAQVTALLVPRGDRARSAAVIGEDVRQRFERRYPGATVRVGMPNAFGFGGYGGAPIQVQVLGSDPYVVDQLATQIQQRIAAVPGAVGLDNSNDNVQTQLRARSDWTRAADLGVNPRDAGAALRAALDGFTSNANQYRPTGRPSIPIRILTVDPKNSSLTDIQRLPVSGARGVVELGQFTTFERARIPTAINHVNRLRSVTIGVNAGGGHLVGDLQNQVQSAVAGVQLPAGYSVTYAGQGQQGGSAFGDMVRAMGLALVLMYMLMMMLFRSLTLPLAVLMSLPLAMIGALGAMALAHSAFTLFSMLGVAVLLGLVGKNAILLVDRVHNLRQAGYERSAALLAAGPSRLRPIVMTTLSVMAALLPIASGLEEGSDLLQSVALVLIGGLVTSTLLTLVFVPAMYTVFDDLQEIVVRVARSARAQDPRAIRQLPAPLRTIEESA